MVDKHRLVIVFSHKQQLKILRNNSVVFQICRLLAVVLKLSLSSSPSYAMLKKISNLVMNYGTLLMNNVYQQVFAIVSMEMAYVLVLSAVISLPH